MILIYLIIAYIAGVATVFLSIFMEKWTAHLEGILIKESEKEHDRQAVQFIDPIPLEEKIKQAKGISDLLK